jgi:hypothetical protein
LATDALTNLGRWDRWYGLLGDDPEPYGDPTTYQLGAGWLRDCSLVEDWGCGKGYLKTFIPPARYRGLDGSRTPFADEVVDLARYRSRVPGIFMRHVLEHDLRWTRILDNAVASFTERMALIVFTPLVAETQEVAFNDDPGVPDIAFNIDDLTSRFGGARWRSETLVTGTQYEVETVFFLERP